MIQDQDIIETNENLTRLNQDLVAIESRPKGADLLASIFRTMKGTTGFLGFTGLESSTAAPPPSALRRLLANHPRPLTCMAGYRRSFRRARLYFLLR